MMTMRKGYFLMVIIPQVNILLHQVLILHMVVILQLKGIHQQDILLRGTHHLDTLPKATLHQVMLEDHQLHITQGMDLAWGHCLLEVLQLQQQLMARLIWPMVLIWGMVDMVATHMAAMFLGVTMDMENSSMASMESMECLAMENSSMASMESMECSEEGSSRSGSKSDRVIGLIDSDCLL